MPDHVPVKVFTESGTQYKIVWDATEVRCKRTGGSRLRGDNEWHTLLEFSDPMVGLPLTLVYPGFSGSGVTVRQTSTVVRIEEETHA